MDFSFGYSPWFLGLCLAVAAGLTYWSYRSTIPALSASWRGLLGGLRFLALALIVFLLFEPVYRQFRESERPPVLAVLVDDSESLQLVTGGAESPTPERARDSLRQVVNALDLQDGAGSSRFFSFGSGLRSLSTPTADSLGFSANQTDVATALEAVRDQLQGENLRGVVLVSDGQYNAGRNPLRVADRYPVPIHTVTVGDTTQRRDLRIRSVATNDRAYLNSAVPVRASVAATGGSGERVTVTLEHDGAILDQQEITLPEGTAEVPVDLTYEPESAGFQQLTVRTTALPNEVTTRNNVQTVSLRVLESRRRVLLLGAAPSPDYTALRRVYEHDADTEVTALVPQQDGSFLDDSLPEDLSSVDVIVCAGFPSPPVPGGVVQRVATAIDDGIPGLFFLDRQTDLSAWAEYFDSALPVSSPARNPTFREAPFTIVERERQHPIFRIDEAAVSLIGQLPPLQASGAEWTPSPDARVLARTSEQTVPAHAPLLVVRRRAGHSTAAFLGTSVWRWALLPSELDRADPIWPGLASNLLRWVSTEESGEAVQVEPVASTFEGSERVEFTGQVYDESMQPVAEATVDVTVMDSTGTTYPHTMQAVGQGRYTLDVGRLPQGTYEYEANARLGEADLGTDQGRFSVGRLRLEYQSTRADPVLMRQIATRSGGGAYTHRTAGQLPQRLADAPEFSSETIQRTSEAELWRTSLFLAIIMVLLAGEWTLRKRFGLA